MYSTPLDGRQDRGQSLVVLSSQLLPGAARGSADSTRTGLLVEVDGVKLRKTMALALNLDSGLPVASESQPSNPDAVGFESAGRVII
jgi:hypothetical protein